MMATIVGLVMGLVATLFRWMILRSHLFFQGGHAGERGRLPFVPGLPPMRWDTVVQALLPALGGLIVGFLIYKLLQLRGGHGVPSVMKSVATGQVNLPASMAIKSATSPVTITTGGSAGPEGPIVEIGAVVGSLIGSRAHARRDQMGTLVGCGTAAGIAAVFGAPMGGVVFALELIMRDLHVRKFAPVVVAAVIASITSSALLPNDPAFARLPVETLQTIQPSGFLVLQFAILGLVCAFVGVLLITALYWMHDFCHAMRIPLWIKPALGGLAVGIVGLKAPGVLGEGYETVNELILAHGMPHQEIASMVVVLLVLCVLKIFVTSITLGSGGTGGSFAPAMVAGAFIGAAVGLLADRLMPTTAPDPRIFALVGMAGVVSSALGTRLGAMFIIFEVSGGHYNLVLPLMITVALSALVTARMKKGSVYTLSLLRDGFDVEEEGRGARDPLRHVSVTDIMARDFVALPPDASLPRILDLLGETDVDAFVVTDASGDLRGVISTNDLRSVINLGAIGEAAFIAQDIADTHAPVLLPDSTANRALEIFGSSDTEGIPVVAGKGSRKVVGMIYRGQVLRAFRQAAAKE